MPKFAIFLIALLALGGSGRVRAVEPLPADFMPSDQVKPGMVGEGRTVFKGFKVEPFKVEILGVQHNAMPGCNMILGRLYGPFLEKHGVVAGMSGSPVFVQGKLIGAVAYGWSAAYEPYCGITPIEQMWTVWQSIGQPGLTEASQRHPDGGNHTQAWDWPAAWQTYQQKFLGQGPAEMSEATTGFKLSLPALAGFKGEMHPLWSPLFLSGASAKSERMLRNFFASQGLELMGSGTMAGSSAGNAGGEPAPPIENGSSLGVPILSGDLSLSGVGTVTYRSGDKLIAFGHPMFFQGGVAVPMAHAYIYGFMESYQRSFKMGDVREEIGTIDQDRQFAIGGKLGPAPPRVPISVQIKGTAASRPRPFHFSCWKYKDYLPMMTAIATQEAFTSSVAEGGELTAEINYRITLADGRVIQKQFHESSNDSLIDPPVMSLLFDMFLLVDNPYREADIQSVDVVIDVKPGYREAELIAARAEHNAFLAGDQVRVVGRFRPWHGEEFDRTFSLDLPKDLRPGSYVVHLADSRSATRIEKTHRPELFAPRDFDGLVQMAQQANHADDQLALYLFEPALDLNLNGYGMGSLPGTTAALIQNTAPANLQQQTVGRLLACQEQKTGETVSGSQSFVIQVVDHFNE